MTRAIAAVALLALAAAAARADNEPPDPKRKVAVLEFRSGSAAIAAIGERAAAMLGAQTSLQVVDADDARKAYGNHLDRDLVACAGQAECVARLGAKLGVDEVLLVGVSEFGDVILTLQRIDVSGAQVLARVAEALAPGAQPDDEAVAAYVRRVMPRSDFLRYGVIRIEANVTGALVTVDRAPRGRTPIAPLRVPAPWTYDIRVDKSGFTGFRASVEVPPDAEVKVRPVLVEAHSDAWYKKWWVAALAGTVAAGAIAIAVVASSDEPSEVPLVIRPFE